MDANGTETIDLRGMRWGDTLYTALLILMGEHSRMHPDESPLAGRVNASAVPVRIEIGGVVVPFSALMQRWQDALRGQVERRAQEVVQARVGAVMDKLADMERSLVASVDELDAVDAVSSIRALLRGLPLAECRQVVEEALAAEAVADAQRVTPAEPTRPLGQGIVADPDAVAALDRKGPKA